MILYLLCLGLCLGLVFWMRRAYLDLPLDRDYGQYLYLGEQWLKEGKLPDHYANAIMAPGRMFLCALASKVCGRETRKIQIFFTCWNALAAAAFFGLSVTLLDLPGGTVACILFVIFSNIRSVMAHYANAESILNLPAILSVLFISLSPAAPGFSNLIPAGFLAGLAIVAKQPAVVNLVFPLGLFLLLREGGSFVHSTAFLAAAAAPAGMLYIYFLAKGAGSRNFFLSLTNLRHSLRFVSHDGSYHRDYMGERERQILRQRRTETFIDLLPLLVIGSGGMAAMASFPAPFPNLLLLLWGAGAILGLILSREYFEYHFIALVPPFSLSMVTSYLEAARHGGILNWVVPAFVLLIGLTVRRNFSFYTKKGFKSLMRGEREYFKAFERLGFRLKERVPEGRTIYVWTGEPTVYYFAERKSACRFTYFVYPNLLYKERFLVQACVEEYHSVLEDLERHPPLALAILWPVLDYFEILNFANRFYRLEEKFEGHYPVLRLREPFSKNPERYDFSLDGNGHPVYTLLLTVEEGHPRVKETLSRIYKHVLEPFELFFLIRGKSRKTAEYLASFYKTRSFFYEDPSDLPRTLAEAAAGAKGEWMVLLSEGALLGEGSLRTLANHLQNDLSAAVAGPLLSRGEGFQDAEKRLQSVPSSPSDLDAACQSAARTGREQKIPVASLSPRCILFSPSRIPALEPFWRAILEKSLDAFTALSRKGFSMIVARDVLVGWDPGIQTKDPELRTGNLPGDLESANGLAKEERWREAGLAFSQLLDWYPENPQVINGLGVSAWNLGHREEALSFFAEGLKRAPDHPDLQANCTGAGIALNCSQETLSKAEEQE